MPRQRRPHRPKTLKDLGFQAYEFQLIGEIVVLCGLIEQILRDMPLWLGGVGSPAASAFTAHLNFQSLCDLNLALNQHFNYVALPLELRNSTKDNLKRAATVFEDRNRIVHGPFTLFADGSRGTLRMIARRKLRSQRHQYDRAKLTSVLSDAVEVYVSLELDLTMLKVESLLQARRSD